MRGDYDVQKCSYNIVIFKNHDIIIFSLHEEEYMLNGFANMEYRQEGDKGLIASPEDVQKASS